VKFSVAQPTRALTATARLDTTLHQESRLEPHDAPAETGALCFAKVVSSIAYKVVFLLYYAMVES
jgi:hypothetical protein